MPVGVSKMLYQSPFISVRFGRIFATFGGRWFVEKRKRRHRKFEQIMTQKLNCFKMVRKRIVIQHLIRAYPQHVIVLDLRRTAMHFHDIALCLKKDYSLLQ